MPKTLRTLVFREEIELVHHDARAFCDSRKRIVRRDVAHAEAAAELGVSQAQISRMEKAALQKLRQKQKLAESFVALVKKLKGDVQKMIDQAKELEPKVTY